MLDEGPRDVPPSPSEPDPLDGDPDDVLIESKKPPSTRELIRADMADAWSKLDPAAVYPQEIEDVLAGHPQLADAAVIGVNDPAFGQRLRAFVVPRAGEQVGDEALTAYLRERLARYKLPREIVVLDEIPRNPTGKVLRRELRER